MTLGMTVIDDMNPIDTQYQKIKSEKRVGLITHAIAGYPSLDETEKILMLLQEGGADFIELQIPFSDPLGDGPLIREASAEALKQGLKVEQVFELLEKFHKQSSIKVPMLVMTYFNIVHRYGLEKFCARAATVGASGLIIPDYPSEAENYDGLGAYCAKNNLYLIDFLSLDSLQERVVEVAKSAQGFVYCFSLRGITGDKLKTDELLLNHLDNLRDILNKPVAVGFGINSAEQVKALHGHADIVIAGSAFIKVYQSGGIGAVKAKIRELKRAL